MGVGGQRHAPAALRPRKTRYPLYKRLGGPQGRSGRVWKISSPPGFDPRTFQSVASRYIDYAISAPTNYNIYKWKLNLMVHPTNGIKMYAGGIFSTFPLWKVSE